MLAICCSQQLHTGTETEVGEIKRCRWDFYRALPEAKVLTLPYGARTCVFLGLPFHTVVSLLCPPQMGLGASHLPHQEVQTAPTPPREAVEPDVDDRRHQGEEVTANFGSTDLALPSEPGVGHGQVPLCSYCSTCKSFPSQPRCPPRQPGAMLGVPEGPTALT